MENGSQGARAYVLTSTAIMTPTQDFAGVKQAKAVYDQVSTPCSHVRALQQGMMQGFKPKFTLAPTITGSRLYVLTSSVFSLSSSRPRLSSRKLSTRLPLSTASSVPLPTPLSTSLPTSPTLSLPSSTLLPSRARSSPTSSSRVSVRSPRT